MNRVIFKSMSDEWRTPKNVYDALNMEFKFKDDPCPIGAEDGLRRDWLSTAFVNPPYSQIKQWTSKAYTQHLQGINSVLLIPARTDTYWWHEFIMKASEIRFIRGRLRFNGSKNNAPFPSCVVVF